MVEHKEHVRIAVFLKETEDGLVNKYIQVRSAVQPGDIIKISSNVSCPLLLYQV